MSRVGKNPVSVPEGVEVNLGPEQITVKGKLGQLIERTPKLVKMTKEGNSISVQPESDSKEARIMWGTARNTLQNMVLGVSEGFEKRLEINGVGYRAAMQGKDLVLQLGFSHEIRFPVPAGIEIKCEKPTIISIKGANRQVVGQVAAEIRKYRPPEPFKGKGVKYEGEYIFRKEGKKK